MKILLVEDDEATTLALTKALATSSYLVNTAKDGWTALELVRTYDYDLLLLDVVIPGLDGLNLCRQLRSEDRQLPIMMLTARGNTQDRVLGLESGADDYVVKPFDWAELTARIWALLRRRQATLAELLTWEKLRVDPNISNVTYNGQPLHLTKTEYRLLELFLRHPQRIFSRSAILDYLWSPTDSPGEWTVTTHIKGLRQKLQIAGMTAEPIETIYGLGYRLRAAPETKPSPQKSSSKKPAVAGNQPSNLSGEAQVLQDIAELWEGFQETLQVLFELFERAIAQLKTGNLEMELRHQSLIKAHQLIGALGTFGVPKGAETARQIEQLLQTLESQEVQRLADLVATLKQAVAVRTPLKINPTRDRLEVSSPHARQLLLAIDDNSERTEQLKTLAIEYDLQIEVVADLTLASAKILARPPEAILLNLAIAVADRTGHDFLAQLAQEHAQIPVVVLEAHPESRYSSEARLRARLDVARLGKYRVLSPLNSPDLMLRAVTQALNPLGETRSKVAIVDDDAYILEMLAVLLEPWGLEVTTLQDPRQFWEMLEIAEPDLLILDVEMPNFSGLELCQIVRNDSRWDELPILFLSAYCDAKTVNEIFTVGADDYVSKPILAAELIARVLNRLKRTKSRWRQQNID